MGYIFSKEQLAVISSQRNFIAKHGTCAQLEKTFLMPGELSAHEWESLAMIVVSQLDVPAVSQIERVRDSDSQTILDAYRSNESPTTLAAIRANNRSYL